ncbi:hypothetical protein M433DRAFT_158614 [Acidomyces richmondensis BFW]|nr:MAG: hypothetical protein FE78DRAFT_92718 [Acidomyces sp. 'richmondensis']KYG41825.1 hypothetical protein M433DRAFT_158614 [Acidomyces richmondensis BFW]
MFIFFLGFCARIGFLLIRSAWISRRDQSWLTKPSSFRGNLPRSVVAMPHSHQRVCTLSACQVECVREGIRLIPWQPHAACVLPSLPSEAGKIFTWGTCWRLRIFLIHAALKFSCLGRFMPPSPLLGHRSRVRVPLIHYKDGTDLPAGDPTSEHGRRGTRPVTYLFYLLHVGLVSTPLYNFFFSSATI